MLAQMARAARRLTSSPTPCWGGAVLGPVLRPTLTPCTRPLRATKVGLATLTICAAALLGRIPGRYFFYYLRTFTMTTQSLNHIDAPAIDDNESVTVSTYHVDSTFANPWIVKQLTGKTLEGIHFILFGAPGTTHPGMVKSLEDIEIKAGIVGGIEQLGDTELVEAFEKLSEFERRNYAQFIHDIPALRAEYTSAREFYKNATGENWVPNAQKKQAKGTVPTSTAALVAFARKHS
jgi:hypothetical protein